MYKNPSGRRPACLVVMEWYGNVPNLMDDLAGSRKEASAHWTTGGDTDQGTLWRSWGVLSRDYLWWQYDILDILYCYCWTSMNDIMIRWYRMFLQSCGHLYTLHRHMSFASPSQRGSLVQRSPLAHCRLHSWLGPGCRFGIDIQSLHSRCIDQTQAEELSSLLPFSSWSAIS